MEVALGPCLEVDPCKFVIVIGPSFTAAVLGEADTASRRNQPAVDVEGMVMEGLSILMESRQFQSEAERAENELLYRKALELDPLTKLSTSMQQCGRYAEWLDRCFKMSEDLPPTMPPILEQLRQLQERGALLVYTGCDDALSKLTGMQVVVAEGEESVFQWKRGDRKGILHVHGVYWVPETVQLNCEVYKSPSHPCRSALEILGGIFRERFVISIGACDARQLDNPMMAVFARTFLTAARHQHSFSLTMETAFPDSAAELCSGLLKLPCLKGYQMMPDFEITPLQDTSKMLCAEIDFPPDTKPDNQHLALLVASKSDASEIARMMFSSPGVSFALVNSVSTPGRVASTVSVRVESAKLADLWGWLWDQKRDVLLSHGLLGIAMQTGTIVWMDRNQKGISMATSKFEPNAERHFKQEAVVPMDTGHSIVQPSPQLLSPLVRQNFPIPKPGTKKVPRYTVTRLPIQSTPGTSFTLPPGNGLSKVHFQGFADDTAAVYSQDLPKNVNWARRSSLPPPVSSGPTTDSMLYKLAENCQSISSELHPPSYTAIKQALLCDKYKRRQSMQTDPKTLKNLLQTKLVISDRSDDLINLRRKSDPGSYMKQRDFERRKELFMDENKSWSKSYGKVIDQSIYRWQKKRQEKLRRDQLLSSWQKVEALNPLKIGMLNPMMAGMINPLQVNSGGLTNATGFSGAFLNTATSGGVVNPYILPQGILAGTAGAAATNTPIYYNPFGTQYTLVSPYTSLQLAGQSAPQTAATTYLVPQATLTNAQPNLYYYMPAALPTTATPSSTSTSPAATPLPLGTTSPVAMTTLTTSNGQHNTMNASGLPVTPPNTAYSQPAIHTQDTSSPPGNVPRPVSPNSRKRHQSVPEKLTSLLQPPPVLCSSGSMSPIELNPDSPPSSKKQRSTSDTTLYHTPYMFGQHSPSGSSGHSPSRHSTSPQPPLGASNEALTTLQSHLLKVHQSSYGITRTALERRRNRNSREKGNNSPRRKHSGGLVKNESLSPVSVQSNDGEELWEVHEEHRISPIGIKEMEESDRMESNIKMEHNEPDADNNTSQFTLWHFLLDLLVSSSDSELLQWTDNEFEFQITKPLEVSKLWGQLTSNAAMNYDKLLSGLQSYFKQGILTQVQGRKLTFKFAGHIRNYVQMRRSQVSSTHEEVVVV